MNKFIAIIILLISLNHLCLSQLPNALSQQQNNDTVKKTELFHDGLLEKMLENYDKAEDYFLECIRLYPQDPAPYYELSLISKILGQYDNAISYAQKALELDKNNEWFYTNLAEIYNYTNKIKESGEIYKRLLKINNNKTEYYYKYTEALFRQGKLKEALKVVNDIETRFGHSEELNMLKIKMILEVKDIKLLVKELNNLIKKYPDDVKYREILGEVYYKTNQKDKAFNVFQEIIKIDSSNYNVHLYLSNYYRDIKDYANSFIELKKAFSQPELDIDTKVQILLSFYFLSEKDDKLKNQAFELINILETKHSNDAKAFSMSGDFYYRDKIYNKAIEKYLKAIELDSSKYLIWEQLLTSVANTDSTEMLERLSQKAIELFPFQVGAYTFNAFANIKLENYEKAEKNINEAIKYVGANKELLLQMYSYLGDIYNNLKEYKKSDEAYEKALNIDPKNIYILNNYSYYLSLREENLDKALEMSRKSNELDPDNYTYQDTYAWILYKKRDYDEAKKWIEKAMKNGGGNDPDIIEHYGDILFQMGDKDKALEIWIKAKEKGGSNESLILKIQEKKLTK